MHIVIKEVQSTTGNEEEKTNMRTYGLSGSGLDVDQLVMDMMKARRVSFDKVWQQKTQTEWQKKDFNTIYTLAQDFRNSTIFDFRKSGNLMPKQVTSSNDTVLTATANADAANVSHSVVVDQLADGVKLSSSSAINGSGTLVSQGYTVGSSIDLKINGQAVSVSVTATTTMNDIVSAVNKTSADVKANYDTTLDRFYIYSNKTGAAAKVDFTGSSPTGLNFLNKLKLGTVTDRGMVSNAGLGIDAAGYPTKTLQEAFGVSEIFSIDITTSTGTHNIPINGNGNKLSDIIGAINSYAGPNAASYDATTQKVTLKADGSTFSISSNNAIGQDFLINKLKLTSYGQDSKIKLDGVELTQPTNNFTISGVAYNLKAVTPTDTNGDPISTNINIQPDIDKTIANVKSFVESYNTFIGAVNTELNETKYRDFLPLTDEQKKDMKENDIKAWEDKAHSGLLRRDPILSNLLTTLRSSFSNPISGLTGDYTSTSSIGITTGSYVDDEGNMTSALSNGGKLYVDEDKLRKALAVDPDIVKKIFGTSGDTMETQGVANRLYDQMDEAIKKVKDQAGFPGTTDTNSSLDKKLKSYDDQLYRMERSLQDAETRYYKQFDAMETALNKLNQQNGWLLQQFSGS